MLENLPKLEAAPTTAAASITFWDGFLETLAHWQPALALLPPSLIFISAIIAWIAIRKNQDVNRRRATIDLIEKSESSEHYQKITIAFQQQLAESRTQEQRETLHNPKTDDEKLVRRHIQQFLNHYELVAVGILGGSLHEKTYRSWMMTVVIRDWNRAADYIQHERWKYDEAHRVWTYHALAYEAFETLSAKWAKQCNLKAIKISNAYSQPPAKPVGPGDEAVSSLDPPATEDKVRPADGGKSTS